MTRQFQHSTNVECGKIMRNLTEFEFEFGLRHIPIFLVSHSGRDNVNNDYVKCSRNSLYHTIALYILS